MVQYQVVSKGINPQAVKAEVEEKFAQLFKLTPEKSAALLSKQQVVLRSNLDEETARAYCDKLIRIGVRAAVVKMAPPVDATPINPAPAGKMSLASLSLEPLPEVYAKKEITETNAKPVPDRKTNIDTEDEEESEESFSERLGNILHLLIPGPKMLMILLAIGVGGYWKINGHLPFVAPEGAYSEKGEPEVVFFNFVGCGEPCDNTIKELNKRGVKFRESTILHSTTLSEETINSSDYKLFEKHGRDLLVIGNRGTKDLLTTGGLVSLLAQTYGDKYLTESEKRYMKNHFDPDGKPRVYIYGATWCGYCKKLRQDLEQQKVDFIELDLDIFREKETISQVMGILGYPTVYVGYKRVANGTDVAEIRNALSE